MSLGRHSGIRKLATLGLALGAALGGGTAAVAAGSAGVKSPAPVSYGYGRTQIIGDPWRASGGGGDKGPRGRKNIKVGKGRSQAARKRSRRRAQRRRAISCRA